MFWLTPVVVSCCRHPVACRRAAPPFVLVVKHHWRALRAREVQACSCLLSLRGLATMAPHMARRELDGAFALSASGQTPTHIADKLRAARHARGAAGPDLTTVRRALRGQTHKRSPKDWGPCLRWAPRLAACDPAPGASEDPIEMTPQKAFGLLGLGARRAAPGAPSMFSPVKEFKRKLTLEADRPASGPSGASRQMTSSLHLLWKQNTGRPRGRPGLPGEGI